MRQKVIRLFQIAPIGLLETTNNITKFENEKLSIFSQGKLRVNVYCVQVAQSNWYISVQLTKVLAKGGLKKILASA